MIEQYTITTTPKYNFPQPNIDTTIPLRFMEQSIQSLKQVPSQRIQLNPYNFQQYHILEQVPSHFRLNRTPINLYPNHQETIIAAVDTSTIKIGETATGVIIAIRSATTWKQNKQYHYTRLGPFVFHITEENKNEVYNTLEQAYFGSFYYNDRHASPNFSQMPTRLANLLERWLQTMLAKTVNQGLILFDGSLTSGTSDTPVQRMKKILSLARSNQSTVLAFSKMTNLRVNGYLITEQLPQHEPPYLLETTGLRFKSPMIPLGDVYVARLNKAKYAFRLDIDKETPVQTRKSAVEKLLGNDVHMQGYPETLRLAHILCTFTANEVLAIKHFIASKHGIQIIYRPDMHKLLFGPFGKGEIYS